MIKKFTIKKLCFLLIITIAMLVIDKALADESLDEYASRHSWDNAVNGDVGAYVRWINGLAGMTAKHIITIKELLVEANVDNNIDTMTIRNINSDLRKNPCASRQCNILNLTYRAAGCAAISQVTNALKGLNKELAHFYVEPPTQEYTDQPIIVSTYKCTKKKANNLIEVSKALSALETKLSDGFLRIWHWDLNDPVFKAIPEVAAFLQQTDELKTRATRLAVNVTKTQQLWQEIITSFLQKAAATGVLNIAEIPCIEIHNEIKKQAVPNNDDMQNILEWLKVNPTVKVVNFFGADLKTNLEKLIELFQARHDFTTIDISNCGLDETSLWQLLKVLPQQSSHTKIIVASNISQGLLTQFNDLTVRSNVTLKSIEIALQNPSIAMGDTQQFTTAVGRYTDELESELEKNITYLIAWKSSNEEVAKIDAKTGIVTALKDGTTEIIALSGNVISQKQVLRVVDVLNDNDVYLLGDIAGRPNTKTEILLKIVQNNAADINVLRAAFNNSNANAQVFEAIGVHRNANAELRRDISKRLSENIHPDLDTLAVGIHILGARFDDVTTRIDEAMKQQNARFDNLTNLFTNFINKLNDNQ